jgi:hypothetical protein
MRLTHLAPVMLLAGAISLGSSLGNQAEKSDDRLTSEFPLRLTVMKSRVTDSTGGLLPRMEGERMGLTPPIWVDFTATINGESGLIPEIRAGVDRRDLRVGNGGLRRVHHPSGDGRIVVCARSAQGYKEKRRTSRRAGTLYIILVLERSEFVIILPL